MGIAVVAAATTTTGSTATATKDCVPWQTGALPYQYPSESYIPICLEPDSTASSSIELDTLFPDGLNFVYAIKEFSDDEILDLATEEYIVDEYEELVHAAVWFEYDSSTQKPSNERVTVWDLDYLDGLEGATEGGNGGCDGVIGKECAEGFLEQMREQVWESTDPAGRKPRKWVDVGEAFTRVNWTALSSCPRPLSEDASFYQARRMAYETDEEGEENFIFPSGNASWAYTAWHHVNDLETEKKRTAVALVVQYPYVDGLSMMNEIPEDKWFTTEDIEVRMACVRHDTSGNGPDDGGSSNDGQSGRDGGGGQIGDAESSDDEDFASSIRVGVASLIVGLAVAGVVNMI